MSRIILITGTFPIYNRGIKVGEEYCVSHGVDEDTLKTVIIDQSRRPDNIPGAYFDKEINEWVVDYE